MHALQLWNLLQFHWCLYNVLGDFCVYHVFAAEISLLFTYLPRISRICLVENSVLDGGCAIVWYFIQTMQTDFLLNQPRRAYTGATTAGTCSLCQPGTYQTGSGMK